MPDGRVIYGEKPVPGAKKVEPFVPQTGNTGVRTVSPEEQRQVQEFAASKGKRDEDRRAQIQEAQKAVQDAEAAQIAGKEPLPGERLGTAGAANRLTEAYFERQQALEATVIAARKRFNDLLAGKE
jgi:succinyl-CoA synthetase alpha subunit